MHHEPPSRLTDCRHTARTQALFPAYLVRLAPVQKPHHKLTRGDGRASARRPAHPPSLAACQASPRRSASPRSKVRHPLEKLRSLPFTDLRGGVEQPHCNLVLRMAAALDLPNFKRLDQSAAAATSGTWVLCEPGPQTTAAHAPKMLQAQTLAATDRLPRVGSSRSRFTPPRAIWLEIRLESGLRVPALPASGRVLAKPCRVMLGKCQGLAGSRRSGDNRILRRGWCMSIGDS